MLKRRRVEPSKARSKEDVPYQINNLYCTVQYKYNTIRCSYKRVVHRRRTLSSSIYSSALFFRPTAIAERFGLPCCHLFLAEESARLPFFFHILSPSSPQPSAFENPGFEVRGSSSRSRNPPSTSSSLPKDDDDAIQATMSGGELRDGGVAPSPRSFAIAHQRPKSSFVGCSRIADYEILGKLGEGTFG